MRKLSSLVGGAVLAASAYATEPTLQTFPDPNYPFVQESADKALKVAYIVAGKSCSVGSTSGGTITKIPFSGGREQYSAHLILDDGDKTYGFAIVDQLDISSSLDYLMLTVSKKGVFSKSDIIQIMDGGFDGHINMGVYGRTNKVYALFLSANGMIAERGKENEPYYQDIYLKALDAVIAACEGK